MEGKPDIFLSTIRSRVRPKSTKYQKTRVKPRPFKSPLGEHAVLPTKLCRWNRVAQKDFLLQPDSWMFDFQWQKGFSLPLLKLRTLHKTLYSDFIDKTRFAHMMKRKRYYSLKLRLWEAGQMHIIVLNSFISQQLRSQNLAVCLQRKYATFLDHMKTLITSSTGFWFPTPGNECYSVQPQRNRTSCQQRGNLKIQVCRCDNLLRVLKTSVKSTVQSPPPHPHPPALELSVITHARKQSH